ncbi:MAG: hypothetical protein LBD63_02825 [Mycoplasmataceae bacterium]|jgi:hypothetical protein|nr:hypothetical protein [Mycoplasmataceae bacterium]
MKNKNQTEALKFRKEDGVPSNPYNNVLTSEQHRIWKRRNKVKVALAAGTAVVGVGGGLGIGYAIGHSQNNYPTPTLALSTTISNNITKVGFKTKM